MDSDIYATDCGLRVAAACGSRRERPDRLLRTLMLLSVMALPACVTRTLEMPAPEAVPSSAGEIVEVESVADERAGSVLGKVDTATIVSGPDLIAYVEAALVNSLSRMGFAVRQVDRDTPVAGRKRVLASLLSAELSSESTLMYPVAVAVRLRIELIDESAVSTFRKEIRGATTRDLGAHRQGGPEDARLLAEVIDQALSSLAVDESFIVAANISPEEAAERRASEQGVRNGATKSERAAHGSEAGPGVETLANRLGTLDRLLKEGLIDQDDYDQKRREILDDI